MKFGTYFAYWEKEWEADYIKYCHKVSELGFGCFGGFCRRYCPNDR